MCEWGKRECCGLSERGGEVVGYLRGGGVVGYLRGGGCGLSERGGGLWVI